MLNYGWDIPRSANNLGDVEDEYAQTVIWQNSQTDPTQAPSYNANALTIGLFNNGVYGPSSSGGFILPNGGLLSFYYSNMYADQFVLGFDPTIDTYFDNIDFMGWGGDNSWGNFSQNGSTAQVMNRLGDVVGTSAQDATATTTGGITTFSNYTTNHVLWTYGSSLANTGTVNYTPTILPFSWKVSSFTDATNGAPVYVGTDETTGQGHIYDPAQSPSDITLGPCSPVSISTPANTNWQQVVGNGPFAALYEKTRLTTNAPPTWNPTPYNLDRLLPPDSNTNIVAPWHVTSVVGMNNGGAIVAQAVYSGSDTNIAPGNHNVLLLPMQIVEETTPGSGVFEPITDNGLDDNARLPIYSSGSGSYTAESDTLPYTMTAVLSANLSSTGSATINVTYTASGGGSYTGTLSETSMGSGVFQDSSNNVTLTLTPTNQSTSSTSPGLVDAQISIPSLSVNSNSIILVPTNTLTYQAQATMINVFLAGPLSSTAVNSIGVRFYNPANSGSDYIATLTETGINTRIFKDSISTTALSIEGGYTNGTSMSVNVSSTAISPSSFDDTLTESSATSWQFSNYQRIISAVPNSTPSTDGQGIFYVEIPGTAPTNVTLVSGSNQVTVQATPIAGQPNLLRTGKLVLIEPGDSFSDPNITTLVASPPSSGGNPRLQVQMYGQTVIDPASTHKAYIGCGFPWGIGPFNQIHDLLTGAPASSGVPAVHGLHWTANPPDSPATATSFLNALGNADLYFVFTHGLTAEGPAGEYLASFRFFTSTDPTDTTITEVNPTGQGHLVVTADGSFVLPIPQGITNKLIQHPPVLVFMDTCYSANRRSGSNYPAFKRDFNAQIYIGWEYSQNDGAGIRAGIAFFQALQHRGSIQNAYLAAKDCGITNHALQISGSPKVIGTTIIDQSVP